MRTFKWHTLEQRGTKWVVTTTGRERFLRWFATEDEALAFINEMESDN